MQERTAGHDNCLLLPEEIDALYRVYDQALRMTQLSRHDLRAERLAAMAIRFYQIGLKDEAALLAMILNTHCRLNGPVSAPDVVHDRSAEV